MSKRLNDKTRSDMSGQGSSGDGNGDMTAELWGEVYDLLCLKMKTDDAYAKLRAKGDNLMCEQIRSKMRKLTEPEKGTSKKTIKKIQKKKTSKPTVVVIPTAAATPTTTTTAPVPTTTAATATTAAATTDIETMGTSFLKPATPAKRRSRKKLSLKISPQEQLTPDVSSAQSVLEQWWEQTPREPTYSPNAPAVTMATGDRDDHEALKLATLPSMDLDTLPLLEASWSPASPEDVHVYSSGTPLVCDDNEDDDVDDNVDLDPYGEAQLTPLQRGCRICRHNNMLRYISCNSGQVMCHVCGLELIDCTCSMLTYDRIMTHDDMPITSAEDHILW
ncbi:uncharacterized protein [Haliotis cracherodii]|uniref:uncharacterized protein n=1 Tax=Haliotis cracherodii TaxID=6455 RepID=UPI0039ECD9F7